MKAHTGHATRFLSRKHDVKVYNNEIKTIVMDADV